MSEPTACTLAPADPDLPSSSLCENCDVLVGLDGLRVRAVVRGGGVGDVAFVASTLWQRSSLRGT